MMQDTRHNATRHHKIAEIGRAYLHNIAAAHKKNYGLETWAKIGNNAVTRNTYAKAL